MVTDPRPARTTDRALTVVTVPILGMTCRSCERRIEREVRRIPAVERVHASAVRGSVEVASRGALSSEALAQAIEAAGYEVGRDPWLSTDRTTWMTAGFGVLVVVGVATAIQLSGLAALAPGADQIGQGGLVVALLLGLAAGVSTCLALTGGLVLALSAAHAASRPPDAALPVIARLRPSAIFVTGRIVGFGLLGAALGAVGATFTLPPLVVALLMVVVAVLMTLLGIRLTGLSPRLAGWTPTLPSGLARTLGLDERQVTAYSDTRAAVLGAATFFLPCGFTQAVQVYALSTGSPLTAGAIMTVFAVGTAPGLLALSGLPSIVPATARPGFTHVVGVVVLAFALVNGTAALRLLGVTPSIAAPSTAATPIVDIVDGVQVLRTFQVADGYLPADAALYAGIPTRWVVESIAGGSCAIFLQAPSLGVSVTLQKGDNAIDLPPLKAGRIDYSCSMGMYGGSLTVVDAPAGALEALARS
jgi:sulfite exporter TauE/SafE/copper chaperone CopZ